MRHLRHIHRWNRVTCRFDDAWVTDTAARGLRHLTKAMLAGMMTCGAAVIPPVLATAGPLPVPHIAYMPPSPGGYRGTPGYTYVPAEAVTPPWLRIPTEPAPFAVPTTGRVWHTGYQAPGGTGGDDDRGTGGDDDRGKRHDVPEPSTLAILGGGWAMLMLIAIRFVRAGSATIEPSVRFTILDMSGEP